MKWSELELGTRCIILLTFGLVLIGAETVYIFQGQLEEMGKATSIAQKASRDAWILANQANQTAIDSERPWVGISFAIQDWAAEKSPRAIVYFTNSGRRPAKMTSALFDSGDFRIFPKNPSYRRNPTDVHGVALILPNSSMSNTQPLPTLTQERLHELASRTKTFFVYASIDYEDVLTRTKHWTHGCLQYLPGFQNASNGFVNCPSYNEIDENQQTKTN